MADSEIKIVDIENDGLEVIQNGKPTYRLVPFKEVYELEIDLVRIQRNEDISQIYGFAVFRVQEFTKGHEDQQPEFKGWELGQSAYTQIAIADGGDADEFKDTEMELGVCNISKTGMDDYSHMELSLTTNYFNELYELVKTRQLSSLKIQIKFDKKDDADRNLYRVYDAQHNLFSHFAIQNMAMAYGEIYEVRFATKPLELNESNWGDYRVNNDDLNEIGIEDYLNKKYATDPSLWESLSNFQKIVIGCLVIIILLSF